MINTAIWIRNFRGIRSLDFELGRVTVLIGENNSIKTVRAIRARDASHSARFFGQRSGRAVSNRIAAAARAAGLVGRFSGHSGRIGMAGDLVASGAGVAAVQVAGRWASAQMPAYYAPAEQTRKRASGSRHTAMNAVSRRALWWRSLIRNQLDNEGYLPQRSLSLNTGRFEWK